MRHIGEILPEVLDRLRREAHNGCMTTPHRATREELAEEFGVDDLDSIADDLYDDYIDYAHQRALEAHEEGDQ